MKEDVLAPFRFRHACKRFDPNRAVPADDVETILEAGRLAPSAFGLEHWRFILTRNRQRIRALEKACFGQPQVGTAAAVIAILARVHDLAPDAPHVARQVLAMSEPDRRWMGDYYGDFFRATDIAAWSVGQCMIAASQMMIAAAMLGVDSCPIGGFEEGGVRAALGIEANGTSVALILSIGYRAEPQPARHRLPRDELVKEV